MKFGHSVKPDNAINRDHPSQRFWMIPSRNSRHLWQRASSSWNSGKLGLRDFGTHPVSWDSRYCLFIHLFFQPRLQVIRVFPVFFLSPSRPDAPLANPAAISFFPDGKWSSATADWLSSVFCFFFYVQPFDTSIVSCFDRPRPPAGNGRNSLVRSPTSRKKKTKNESALVNKTDGWPTTWLQSRTEQSEGTRGEEQKLKRGAMESRVDELSRSESESRPPLRGFVFLHSFVCSPRRWRDSPRCFQSAAQITAKYICMCHEWFMFLFFFSLKRGQHHAKAEFIRSSEEQPHPLPWTYE